jgi:hypothetical protein
MADEALEDVIRIHVYHDEQDVPRFVLDEREYSDFALLQRDLQDAQTAVEDGILKGRLATRDLEAEDPRPDLPSWMVFKETI